ncbi:MAG: hypothetical protein FJX76_06320 [Armatimonadetes bacterium]|nr:hypothetical protein [Armatimonadota bacterium]
MNIPANKDPNARSPQTIKMYNAAQAPKHPTDVAILTDDAGKPSAIVLPATRPMEPRPLSGNSSTAYMVGGTIACGLAGSYVSLTLLSAHPLAGLGVAVGSAVLGAVVGYLAGKPEQKPQ